MLKVIICCSLVMFSYAAFGEVYLCIPEASTGIAHGQDGKDIKATAVKYSDKKYALSNESGKWLLKELIDNNSYTLLDHCVSQYACEKGNGLGGVFFREKDGVFTLFQTVLANTGEYLAVVSEGHCSKL